MSIEQGVVPITRCETCHEDRIAHADGGGDHEPINIGRSRRGQQTVSLVAASTPIAVSCRAGMHANSATVSCLTCHSIHASEQQALHHLAKGNELTAMGTTGN